MTCPSPFPERLNPPDHAATCAICKRETRDGREIELCDEDVEGLRSLSMIRLSAAVETGKQWVCERCQQDLDAIHRKERSDAFDDLAEALGWDLDEHPVIHAKRLIAEVRWMRAELQRLQSSPAPVVPREGYSASTPLDTSDPPSRQAPVVVIVRRIEPQATKAE